MIRPWISSDLILVDGGITQIGACKSVLDELHLNIKVCGLRKDDHHRTNELVDGDTLKVYDIPKGSDIFHYLTRIQDEVHRFTITYHKTLRDKGSIGSILDNIDGIGSVRKKELIKRFGSIKKMKEASIEELSGIIEDLPSMHSLQAMLERCNYVLIDKGKYLA